MAKFSKIRKRNRGRKGSLRFKRKRNGKIKSFRKRKSFGRVTKKGSRTRPARISYNFVPKHFLGEEVFFKGKIVQLQQITVANGTFSYELKTGTLGSGYALGTNDMEDLYNAFGSVDGIPILSDRFSKARIDSIDVSIKVTPTGNGGANTSNQLAVLIWEGDDAQGPTASNIASLMEQAWVTWKQLPLLYQGRDAKIKRTVSYKNVLASKATQNDEDYSYFTRPSTPYQFNAPIQKTYWKPLLVYLGTNGVTGFAGPGNFLIEWKITPKIRFYKMQEEFIL